MNLRTVRFLNGNEIGIRIGQLLSSRGLTLASAESCTGGTIASMVTAVPGSSSYFRGAVVSYAVEVKEDVLGVDVSDGVVSESTARQMAEGVARLLKSDCAVATTGIAGPGGAEPGKPVGTVCIAVLALSTNSLGNSQHPNHCSQLKSQTLHFSGDRESVILQAADCALRLLEEILRQ